MSEPTLLRLDVKVRGVRCPIRDDHGHRCNQPLGHEGLHRAFGAQFKSSVLIAKVKP